METISVMGMQKRVLAVHSFQSEGLFPGIYSNLVCIKIMTLLSPSGGDQWLQRKEGTRPNQQPFQPKGRAPVHTHNKKIEYTKPWRVEPEVQLSLFY